MAISSRIARPLLASIFIAGGADAFRHPEGKVKAAEKVVSPLAREVPFVPDNAEMLVKFNGGIQVGAALLLSVGKFRRLAALALAGSLIPTTYAGHAFWSELDDEKKAQQQMHFLKNAAILGGLLLAATDTEGAPSTSWRVKGRVRRAGRNLRRTKVTSGDRAQHALKQASISGGQARRKMEGLAATELSRGSDVATSALATGTDIAAALIHRAQDYLPA